MPHLSLPIPNPSRKPWAPRWSKVSRAFASDRRPRAQFFAAYLARTFLCTRRVEGILDQGIMRGRKPESSTVKLAKGNPRKQDRASLEQRAAALAASPAKNAGVLAPPAFLQERSLRSAAKIWNDLAPEMVKSNLLSHLDRHTFARWCVYQADWIEATRSIQKDGIWTYVKNVNGEPMPRRNPSCAHRDRCENNMQSIEAAFGLTPAHRYKLLRDQAALPSGGLFDREPQPAEDKTSTPAREEDDPIGLMTRRSSTTPGLRPN